MPDLKKYYSEDNKVGEGKTDKKSPSFQNEGP